MSGVPVKCERCGRIWPSRQFKVVQGSNISFTGNYEGPCATCGGMGRVMVGRYSFDRSGTPSLLAGPPETQRVFRQLFGVLRDRTITTEQIAALKDVVRQRQEHRISEAEATAEAARINPKFVELVRGQELNLLSIFLSMLSIYLSVASSRSDAAQHAEVMAALRQQQEQAAQLYDVEIQQLEQLRLLAEQKVSAENRTDHSAEKVSPPTVDGPPPGPRTKRQRRRDRRFVRPAAPGQA